MGLSARVTGGGLKKAIVTGDTELVTHAATARVGQGKKQGGTQQKRQGQSGNTLPQGRPSHVLARAQQAKVRSQRYGRLSQHNRQGQRHMVAQQQVKQKTVAQKSACAQKRCPGMRLLKSHTADRTPVTSAAGMAATIRRRCRVTSSHVSHGRHPMHCSHHSICGGRVQCGRQIRSCARGCT